MTGVTRGHACPEPFEQMPALTGTARHDMSVILVTGSYDHEIRFWEAWSGICSRTIARSGESGVGLWFSNVYAFRSILPVVIQQVNRLAISPE
jgi:hypothetical protein